MNKTVGLVNQGSFMMWEKLYIVDEVRESEGTQLVRFHSADDIYDVYEWKMDNILRAINEN